MELINMLGHIYTLVIVIGATLSAEIDDIDHDAIERLELLDRAKRVIGGYDIEQGEWPYLVHLRGKIPYKWFWGIPTGYKNYYCGGAVVNRRWVVTAAHCLDVPDAPSGIMTPKYWHAKVGQVKRQTNAGDWFRDIWGRIISREEWTYVNAHATKLVKHPSYKRADLWLNDIAMIKVNKDLFADDSTLVEAVKLPDYVSSTWPTADTKCMFKGWGCTSDGGPLNDVARAVSLPPVSQSQCNYYYGDVGSSRLCAGYSYEDKGICKGDSGGPLVCKHGTSWKLAGIASFTSAKRSGSVPGCFTDAKDYLSFIRNTIRNN